MSSLATLRSPAVIYHEEQYFGWWVYALLAAMVAVGGFTLAIRNPPAAAAAPVPTWNLELPVTMLVGFVLPPVLVVGVLRMTTEVVPSHCVVWFGLVPTYRRAFPIESIDRVEVVTYRPIADCGGWGIRKGRDGERVFNARGNRGVRLHMKDGSLVLIGSQCPEELARALDQAMRPDV